MAMATSVDRRPVSLLESAESCVRSLEELKKNASDSKAKHTHSTRRGQLLDKVDSDVTSSIWALKAWIAAFNKGRQTSDDAIIVTFGYYLDTINSHTNEVSKVLDRRLNTFPLEWHKSKHEAEDSENISKNLKSLRDIIGTLHNTINTVLRDSQDQKRRQEKITEVVSGRPKSYHVFVRTLRQMSEEERRTTRFGTMQLLWQEIPARPDLEGHVDNVDDPGDGKVYSEHEIQKAGSVLKAFYDAWHEATIKANSANAGAPEHLRRVKKLTDMARICLILRAMKQERLLDHICEHDKDDRQLPLEQTMLERILGPDDAPHASTFVAEQYRAICRTWNDGHHLEIPEVEPLPLEHIDKYGDGAYGSVTKTKHAFTGMYYARKEQTGGSNGLRREILRLKRLSHRHIVQFVKSYQRGNKYGILLRPAATTDLHKLLRRYCRNRPNNDKDTTHPRRDRFILKPIILTAFGCLSRGLSYIHGRHIRHMDIKPSNILYQAAFPSEPARFLWADFGLFSDFRHLQDDINPWGIPSRPPRYAVPEYMEQIEAGRLSGEFYADDSDESDTDKDLSSQEPHGAQRSAIEDGRKSDIYSFGIVFLEILSYLNAHQPEYENSVPRDFEACMPIWTKITATQEWAQTQAQELSSKDPKSPLVLLFQLGSQMISHDPEARPSITQVVSCLREASPAYFCTACQQEPEQYDLQQEDVSVREVEFNREADQGSRYEEASWGDSHYMQRNLPSNEGESSVISLDLHDFDGILPDAENGNNDDLASLLSIPSFADSGYESLDNPDLRDEADELTLLLLDDQQLQTLFTIIFRRSKAQERFVSKFRMLLRIFGADLKREARDASHEAAAELAKLRATYIANEIQNRYMMEKAIDNPPDGKRSARVATSLMRRLDFPQPNLDSDVTDQYDYASDSEASNDTDGIIDEEPTYDQLPKLSLEKLKEFMICSQAFANLQNALRRMVYPDPLDAINDKVSNAYKLCPGKASAVFNVHLDINNYLSSELNYQRSLQERSDLLGSVLTISGTASKAFATTAANYLRWKWPRTNFGLLEAIERSVKERGSKIRESTHPKIMIEKPYDHSGLKIVARGSLDELKAIAQQLAWITASFRIPEPRQTSYSEISLESVGEMSFDIRPLQLEAIRRRESACWLPLFENGIIARGFPVPARHGQKGIELPFPVMTGLANIMYPVFYEDGLYLRGVSRLLFPTAVSPDLKSVQWHLISSPSKHIRLPHGTLPSEDVDHQWLKVNDLERLASASRTFLGYCRAVEVHLGTQAAKESYEAVTFSGADDEAPGPGVSPKSVTTGTPGLGIWSFQVSMDIVLPKGLYSTAEPGWYLDLVDLAKEERVLVYDNAQKGQRAWLLPTLGVVLHMAHIWAVGKDLVASPPYAAPHWDSGQASFEAIQRHSKEELRDSMEVDKAYTLKDLIGRLLMSLDKLNETEAHARSEPGRSVKLQNSKLFGWELLAVAQGKKIVKRKQIDLGEDWMILGADNLVLFCQNFGDVIRPASGVRMCQLGNLARYGKNYLTAPIKCLQTLSIENSGHRNSTCLRLANQAYWLPPEDDVFGDCTQCLQPCHGKLARCAKTPQQLLNKEPSSHKACKSPPIEGAISFGKRKLQKSNTSITEVYTTAPETSTANPAVAGDTSQTSHDAPIGALVVPEIHIMSNATTETSPPPNRNGRRLSPRVAPESPDTSVSNEETTSLSSRSIALVPSSSSGVTDISDSSASNTTDGKRKSFSKRLGNFRKYRSKLRHNTSTNNDT